MYTKMEARRVVIIVDASLKQQLIDKVKELGVHGYNYVTCAGAGRHPVSGDPYTGDNLIRLEVICTEGVAKHVLDYVHASQFGLYGRYALAAFSHVVDVDIRHPFTD